MPGDPSREDYKAGLPNSPLHLIFTLGAVTASYETLPGNIVTFPLLLSKYVQGTIRESTLRYIFLFQIIFTDCF